MRIVFFGTPYYVLPIIERLNRELRTKSGESPIVAVVTQPPRPVGRNQALEFSAVDKWAHKRKIPIYFDALKLMDDGVRADLGILASYGALIPSKALIHFTHGILVVHPSLLPKLRWGSPVPAALVTGENPTGVSIIKMDSKFDHGPIVTSFKEEVRENDNTQSLRDRLFELSAGVLCSAIPAYVKGKIHPKHQDDSKATFARMVKKEDAFIAPKYLKAIVEGKTLKIKWTIPFVTISGKPYQTTYSPLSVDRFIRAMEPWPGTWTEILVQSSNLKVKKRLKILKVHLERSPTHKLIIDTVQLEGKNAVSWKEFRMGYPGFDF